MGWNADELNAGERGYVCRTGRFVEDGHFAEEFAFAQDGQGDVAIAGLTANLGPTRDNEIDGVAPGVLHEDGAASWAVANNSGFVDGF